MITPEIKLMAHLMYKMLPIKDSRQSSPENLTEIPIPPETQRSRFISIAESEPFGPIDAAKVFELEPAQVTLEKLSDLGEHSDHHTLTKTTSKNKQFLAEKKSHERFHYKFTDVHVSEQDVGFRYGKTNRDNKKNRRIGFDNSGKMIYLL